ncbi:uncharacterized protein LOC142340106 isoform X2 [Convolutriloba macropyga]|uniref:uncharacterized protein LOC142340106 isoform X2 n=1 Tax=Convolutriloba macropyga TaxID=536237 RepID=UPI003F51CC30
MLPMSPSVGQHPSYGQNTCSCFFSYEQQQLRSDWMEQLDGLAMEKKAKKDRATIREEFRLAKRALIKVRQHMLAQLLESERETFKQELAKMGKAIHIDRL